MYDRELHKKHQATWLKKNGFDSPAEYQKWLRATFRAKVIEALGCVCVQCGFADARALQVDHVNGDGHEDRKKKVGGNHWKNVLAEIERGSDRYQLLCANCNWIKRADQGEFMRH